MSRSSPESGVRRWSGVIVVNNELLPWYEGMTVGDLLRAKAPSSPMVSVWVDGKLLAGKETETFYDCAQEHHCPLEGSNAAFLSLGRTTFRSFPPNKNNDFLHKRKKSTITRQRLSVRIQYM